MSVEFTLRPSETNIAIIRLRVHGPFRRAFRYIVRNNLVKIYENDELVFREIPSMSLNISIFS